MEPYMNPQGLQVLKVVHMIKCISVLGLCRGGKAVPCFLALIKQIIDHKISVVTQMLSKTTCIHELRSCII